MWVRMGQEDVDLNNRINSLSCQLQQLSWSPTLLACGSFAGDAFGAECTNQLNLLLQAQALLSKNMVYQKIDAALQRLMCCAPHVFVALNHGGSGANGCGVSTDADDAVVTGPLRDGAVANLRFLNVFFNYRHETFAHAVHLLDSILSRVQVHPKFLSSIATSCLYIAAKANEPTAPNPHELLALGAQPGGTLANLLYTERVILELVGFDQAAPCNIAMPLTFLRLFHEIMSVDCGPGSRQMKDLNLAAIVGNMEVLQCQFELTRFRADVLALALLSHHIEAKTSAAAVNGSITGNPLMLSLAELQFYCQINGAELAACRALVSAHLAQYGRQQTKLPRLRLSWSVSRRTLHKMKPSTRAAQDLEPIMEDDVIGPTRRRRRSDEDDDEDDSSAFDSGTEESSLVRDDPADVLQSEAAIDLA